MTIYDMIYTLYNYRQEARKQKEFEDSLRRKILDYLNEKEVKEEIIGEFIVVKEEIKNSAVRDDVVEFFKKKKLDRYITIREIVEKDDIESAFLNEDISEEEKDYLFTGEVVERLKIKLREEE